MATPEQSLPTTDARMLELMEYCIRTSTRGITTRAEWSDAIGLNANNLAHIRSGNRGFTRAQLLAAGQVFGVSMDWLFGFSGHMFRAPSNAALQKALEGVKVALLNLETASVEEPTTQGLPLKRTRGL